MYSCVYAYTANTMLICKHLQKQKFKNKYQENRPIVALRNDFSMRESMHLTEKNLYFFSYLSKSVAQILHELQNSVHFNINSGQCQTSTVFFWRTKSKES